MNQTKQKTRSTEQSIPIKDKYLLTFEEAAAYFNIGRNHLRELAKDPGCDYAVKVGDKKTLIIRVKLEEYLLHHRALF